MAWSRRPKPEAGPPVHPVTAFWRWWVDEGERRATEAIRAGDYGELPAQISEKVLAIHPDLAWELAAGREARHALVVSAGGVAELRPVAERWWRASPPASPTWEYHAARQADPGAAEHVLEFDGRRLALADVVIGAQVNDRLARVDVTVHHPAFAAMTGSGPTQVTYLVLDWLLGEDDVERWVGGVEASATPPPGAAPAGALPGVVAELAARTPLGEWALLEGSGPSGARVIVSARHPLRWIDQPLLDQHNTLASAFADRRPDGLPTPDALDGLRGLEDDLTATFAGRAELLVVETSEGRRTWHVYSDSEDQNTTDLLNRWASDHGVSHAATPDPAWRDLDPFR